jgi:acetyl esterase/lipase
MFVTPGITVKLRAHLRACITQFRLTIAKSRFAISNWRLADAESNPLQSFNQVLVLISCFLSVEDDFKTNMQRHDYDSSGATMSKWNKGLSFIKPMQASLVLVLAAIFCSPSTFAQSPVKLWPAQPKLEKPLAGPEEDITKPTDNKVADRSVIRLGNVSDPTVTFYPADSAINTGTTVLVCPGGGYHILAMDLEGTEVCEWLATLGVNSALLKYRVPRREGRDKHAAPLEDAQRAMSIIRSRAQELSISPDKIGVLGFSAGGHLATMLCTSGEKRSYEKIDELDSNSCRPNFGLLIYPGYLIDEKAKEKIVPEIAITADMPPVFLTMAEDDPIDSENALRLAIALKQAKVPFSLHLFPTGGHGYGLRRTSHLATHWPDQAGQWMKSNGWLEKPK